MENYYRFFISTLKVLDTTLTIFEGIKINNNVKRDVLCDACEQVIFRPKWHKITKSNICCWTSAGQHIGMESLI